MDDYRQRFLEAEGQASKLAERLEHLKDEIESYAEASGSLRATREDLQGLAKELEGDAVAMRDVISAIEAIGTEKILDSVSDVQKDIRQGMRAMNEHNEGSLASLRKGLEDRIEDLKAHMMSSLEWGEQVEKRLQGDIRRQQWILFAAIGLGLLNLVGILSLGFLIIQGVP